MPLHRVALVSCVKTKANRTLPAGDLYTSDWFQKAKALVHRSGIAWFILSAEHGLIAPSTPIAPYEKTLNKMGVTARREWAMRVQSQMEKMIPEADEIIVLAGERYRENLMPILS